VLSLHSFDVGARADRRPSGAGSHASGGDRWLPVDPQRQSEQDREGVMSGVYRNYLETESM
jgi:hypothetical protein